jgi:hypothetical protein
MQVPHISVSESLLLRSPTASQGQGGALGEAEARKRGNTVGIRDQAMDLAKLQGHKVSREVANLPTPTVSDQYTGNLASTQQKPGSMHSVTLAQVFHKPDLFPTPVAADWKNGRPGEGYGPNLPQVTTDLMPTPKALDGVKGNLKTSQERLNSGHQVDLPNVAIDLVTENRVKLFNTPTTMDAKATNNPVIAQKFLDQGRQTCLTYDVAGQMNLPTPTASDWKGANHSGSGSASSRSMATVVEQTNWGKFEPAIRRWEAILGRQAPEPTKPDGKDGNHRLSSKFTEWMMGLPDGWITGHDLKRNDELKLAGNGVVPQQAELALRLLLELPEIREN